VGREWSRDRLTVIRDHSKCQHAPVVLRCGPADRIFRSGSGACRQERTALSGPDRACCGVAVTCRHWPLTTPPLRHARRAFNAPGYRRHRGRCMRGLRGCDSRRNASRSPAAASAPPCPLRVKGGSPACEGLRSVCRVGLRIASSRSRDCRVPLACRRDGNCGSEDRPLWFGRRCPTSSHSLRGQDPRSRKARTNRPDSPDRALMPSA